MRKPRIGHLERGKTVGYSVGKYGAVPRILTVAAIACILPMVIVTNLGCGSSDRDAPTRFAKAAPPYSPIANSGNAFDSYAQAASDVEQKAGKTLDRVYFYPGNKLEAEKLCEDPLRTVSTASRLPCTFQYVAHAPFTVGPYQRGWRLLGRVLRWKIERACETGEFDAAIDAALLATKFGFDLTGGGPSDASLGFSIADEARVAIASHLRKMGAAQLDRLATGILADLGGKPAITKAIEHDDASSKMSVQALQDACLSGDFRQLSDNLGPGSKEAISYLEDLRGNEGKRLDYFKGFAAEGEQENQWLMNNASRPTAQRAATIQFEKRRDRPWKHFAHHFFLASVPLLEMNDRTLARTKLLVLNALLIKADKTKQGFPRDLASFPPDLVTDPYSGNPFPYRSDPAQYSIYSVGKNLRDDAGDTDESFTSPDLKLEIKE